MHDLAIQGDRFHGAMAFLQNGSTGCFVTAAGFHADIAVLDDIAATNTMFATNFIELSQQSCATHGFAVERNRITLEIGQFDFCCLVRCVFRRDGPAPHVV